MKALITGGAGFIGSHLSDLLLKEKYNVSILDNLISGTEKNISHIKNKIDLNIGDIRDETLVDKLVQKSDVVFHLAAVLGVDQILANPVEAISTNFHGSEIVLKSALKFDKRIVIASTSEIYGKNSNQPLIETDDRVIGAPQKLRWTYSDAKALEEAMAYFLYITKNLKVTTVRLFNTVGPRQSGKYGMVIPRFINSALANNPIRIFGSGEQSRTFCHVYDSIRALVKLSCNDKTIGEVFNVGGNNEISIFNLAKLIKNHLKSSSTITFSNYEDVYSIGFEDMFRRVPNILKIKEYINWSPELTLENIIDDVALDLS